MIDPGAKITNVVTFGRRKVRPRVCVTDGKNHLRTFLIELFEELGFVACECGDITELVAALDAQRPDLVVLGLSTGAIEASEMMKRLAAKTFGGKVLVIGPPACPAMAAIRDLAEELEIEMLPTLATPFGEMSVRDSVAALLPTEDVPDPPIHLEEAVRAGWLELWYQPIVDARSLALDAAEALIRIRHPTWGIVPPAYFIPDDGDPHLRALSEFVVGRAIADWHNFITQRGRVEIAINMPIAVLQDAGTIRSICEQLPQHPAFDGLIIEINGTEVVRNLEFVTELARELRFHNIAISIDDSGPNGPCSRDFAIFLSPRSRSIANSSQAARMTA
jgi:hypothetical protein